MEVHESTCGLLDFMQTLDKLHIKKHKLYFFEGNASNTSVI